MGQSLPTKLMRLKVKAEALVMHPADDMGILFIM